MGSNEGQTYCLRWNNHKSNLVEILDALIKMESYVDCTIYVDDHVQFKAHRVVLAANSPYFQAILQGVPMDHCTILFPEVQAFEMRALLEYMYTGEVNVTQSQIPRIIKIARDLEVKGLNDMADLKDLKEDGSTHYSPQNNNAAKSPKTLSPSAHSTNYNNIINNSHNNNNTNNQIAQQQQHHSQSSPVISTSTNVNPVQSSSSSPPYSYKSPYSSLYVRSPIAVSTDRISQWPSHLPSPVTSQIPSSATSALLSSVYDTGSDMNPLKRKKLSSISSMLMSSRDTPILRNVLAQSNIADSSQAVPLVCQPSDADRNSDRHSTHSNGTDYSEKKLKHEEPHSPYTDKSFEDEPLDHSQLYGTDSRIVSYVPQQKPEWKRYKQYTRDDIQKAIECVRNGMSALQASRKYGVPSRTLYDKVKKLGIVTGRPMNRSMKRSPSHGSLASFPYGLSGAAYVHHNQDNSVQSHNRNDNDRDHDHLPPTIPHPAAALLDASFLQQALEARGGDIAGREALHAMAFAAAAHAAVNGISTSPGTHGTARSPSPDMVIKYGRPPSPKDEEDHVEDLSMSRKDINRSYSQSISPQIHSPRISPQILQHILPSPPIIHTQQQSSVIPQGVIVPPMTKVSTPKEDYNEVKRELIITTEDDSRD